MSHSTTKTGRRTKSSRRKRGGDLDRLRSRTSTTTPDDDGSGPKTATKSLPNDNDELISSNSSYHRRQGDKDYDIETGSHKTTSTSSSSIYSILNLRSFRHTFRLTTNNNRKQQKQQQQSSLLSGNEEKTTVQIPFGGGGGHHNHHDAKNKYTIDEHKSYSNDDNHTPNHDSQNVPMNAIAIDIAQTSSTASVSTFGSGSTTTHQSRRRRRSSSKKQSEKNKSLFAPFMSMSRSSLDNPSSSSSTSSSKHRHTTATNAETLINLTDIFLKKRDYIKAKEYCLKALPIVAQWKQSQHHLEIVNLYDKLGDIELALEREEEAIMSYEKALEMMTMIGMDCYSSTSVYEGGEVGKEESAFEVMMNMRRRRTNSKVVRVLNKRKLTEDISRKLRDLSPSSPLLAPINDTTTATTAAPSKPMNQQQQKRDIKDLKRHSRNMYNMACLALSMNNTDKAIDYLHKSIDARVIVDPYDVDNVDLALTFEKLGNVLIEKKEEDGLGYYKRAFQLVNDLLSADNLMENERKNVREVHERIGARIADIGGTSATNNDNGDDGPMDDGDDVTKNENDNRAPIVPSPVPPTATTPSTTTTPPTKTRTTTPTNKTSDDSSSTQQPLSSPPPSNPQPPPPPPPTLSSPTDDAYLKGCTHLQNHEFHAAIIQFQNSLDINNKTTSKNVVVVGMIYHKCGKSHYGLQDYDKAMECYNLALRDENLVDDGFKMALLCDLGDAYRGLKRYNESLSCYKRALTLKRRQLLKDDDDDEAFLSLIIKIMTIHRQLADDVSIQNDAVVAVNHYRAALAIGYPPIASIIENRTTQQQQQPPTSDTDNSTNTTPSQSQHQTELTTLYISIAKTLGNLLCQSNQFHDALAYFSQILYIRSNGSHCIISESASAVVALEVSDVVTIEDVATKKAVAVILHNMGVIYEKIKCFDMAIDLYSHSLLLKRDVVTLSKNDDDAAAHYIIKTVNCLGYAHYLNGNDDDALDYFKQVKDLLKKNVAKKKKRTSLARDYIHTLNDMAMIYSRKNSSQQLSECLAEKKSLNEMISRWESVELLKKRGMEYCFNKNNEWIGRAVDCFHEAIEELELLRQIKMNESESESENEEDEDEDEDEDLLFFYLGLTMCYAIQGFNDKRLKYYDLFMTIQQPPAVETTRTTTEDGGADNNKKEEQQQDKKMTRVALLIQMGRRLLSRRTSSRSSLDDHDHRRLLEGINYFETALDIISSLEQQKTKHDDDDDGDNYNDLCLALLNDIGNAYVILHEEDRAMTFYNRALKRAASTVVMADDDDGEEQQSTLTSLSHDKFNSNNKKSKTAGNNSNYSTSISSHHHHHRRSSSSSHVITSNDNDADYDFSAMASSCYENDNNNKNRQQQQRRYYLNTANVHHNLAYLHAKKGTKEEQKRAIELYHSSLQWKAFVMGDVNTTMESLSTLVNLGTVEFRLKNYNEALTHLNRALELMNKTTTSSSSSSQKTRSLKTATILNKIGNIHGAMQKYTTARLKYTQALTLKTQFLQNKNHPEILITRHNLGLILSKEGKYDEALEVLRDVCHAKLHYLYNDDEENHPDMAKLFLDMATVALMMTNKKTTTRSDDDGCKKEEEEERQKKKEDEMMTMAREWCERAKKVLDCFELGENHSYVRQWKVCVGMLK